MNSRPHFKQPKEHCYEIIEAYAGMTFRITKIKFTVNKKSQKIYFWDFYIY